MALDFPDSPSLGQIYINNDTGFTYRWDGVVWKSITQASSSRIQIIDDISTAFNAITTTFSLTVESFPVRPANKQSIFVILGGVHQNPVTDYSVSGTNITFTTPPVSGLSFSAILLGSSYDTQAPAIGSVGTRNGDIQLDF